MNFWSFLLAIIIIVLLFIPYILRKLLALRRSQVIHTMEGHRHSRVITLIHRQDYLSFFGLPTSRYLDMDDAEKVLRAIYLTPNSTPIDLVVHSPGGMALAAEQIAFALSRHEAKVTVFVPYFAMSGGTIIALAADEIVLSPNSVLGTVDPALGVGQGSLYPATSVIKAVEHPNANREDQTLILADMAEKSIIQVRELLYSLLSPRHGPDKALLMAYKLSEGRWTHDHPLFYDQLAEMGLPISKAMPKEAYDLLNLYAPSGLSRSMVEFINTAYNPEPPYLEDEGQKS